MANGILGPSTKRLLVRQRVQREYRSVALDVLPVALGVCAVILWLSGLQRVNLMRMTDLGLVSIMSPLSFAALALLVSSFLFALGRPHLHTRVLVFHLILLVIMLYGIPAMIEQAPRFASTYPTIGLAEYIMRTGRLAPNAQTYYSWPGLFIFTSLALQTMAPHGKGIPLVLEIVNWTPVLLNLLYLGPLYMIMRAICHDRRVVWLALGLFTLTNWIAQDYFSPQGFAYFLYLTVLAIALTWFRPRVPSVRPRATRPPQRRLPQLSRLWQWFTTPDDSVGLNPVMSVAPRLRAVLLAIMLAVFALAVFSHPITPIFIIMGVTILALYHRTLPLWVPILMAVLFALWFGVMARPFWIGHMDLVTGNIGNLKAAFAQNVSDRVAAGTAEHQFVVRVRLILSGLIWGLAGLGMLVRQRQGQHDAAYILLAVTPLALVPIQPYGGEMLLRSYLFGLPFMVFFAASFLRSTPNSLRASTSAWAPLASSAAWITARTTLAAFVLLGCFLVARYGNEREDFVTSDELAAVQYLYHVAPPQSLLIEGWVGAPWEYQYWDRYTYYSMWGGVEDYQAISPAAVQAEYIPVLMRTIAEQRDGRAYVLFTHNQKAYSTLQSGLPSGMLDQLEQQLLTSGQFKLMYSNPEAQILKYTGSGANASQLTPRQEASRGTADKSTSSQVGMADNRSARNDRNRGRHLGLT